MNIKINAPLLLQDINGELEKKKAELLGEIQAFATQIADIGVSIEVEATDLQNLQDAVTDTVAGMSSYNKYDKSVNSDTDEYHYNKEDYYYEKNTGNHCITLGNNGLG